MTWLVIFLTLALVASFSLLWRAGNRLLQFDSILQIIIDPMREYSKELKRISSSEGLLHDNPEVLEFHKANTNLLRQIELAIAAVEQEYPKKDKKQLPRPEAV